MRLIKILLGPFLGYLLLACNLLTTLIPSPIQPPTGSFFCDGIENGFYAYAGDLVLHPDGTLEFNGDGGTWDYNVDTREITINGNKYLATGIYDPERNFVSLTLKSGVTISHAETGSIGCHLSEQ